MRTDWQRSIFAWKYVNNMHCCEVLFCYAHTDYTTIILKKIEAKNSSS